MWGTGYMTRDLDLGPTIGNAVLATGPEEVWDSLFFKNHALYMTLSLI